MASQIKVIQTDITKKALRALLTQIVKHAFSALITDEKKEFKGLLNDKQKHLEYTDILKMKSFREELVAFTYN